MKVSRFKFAVNLKEKTIVKKMMLVLAAAVLFVSTLAMPTVAHADGSPTGTSCGGGMCKP